MQRVTITIEDDLLAVIDERVQSRGYQGRSEAIRDLIRTGLSSSQTSSSGAAPCVGALVYVYAHEARELSRRLTGVYHQHHALSVSSLHVHLDDDRCMEVAILKGIESEVRHFAEHVIAERGVQHGQLVAIPLEATSQPHAHARNPHHHGKAAASRKKPSTRKR